MAKIAVVTDSVSDLPRSTANEYGITVVPIYVRFGEDVYRDGVDIVAADFFKRLETTVVMPTTSQPSPADFQTVYESLLKTHDHIVSIHVSSKLSGTYQSAILAKGLFDTDRITIIDSQLASFSVGFAVVAAAKTAKDGADLDDVVKVAQQVAGKARLLFSVDTLKYLERNGRIGKASAFLGGLLSIKPIISLGDGEVIPVEKVRGSARLLPRILEIMKEKIGEGKWIHAAIIHANCASRAQEWKEAVERAFPCRDVVIAECGPGLGAHTGPDSIGITWYVE